MSEDYIAGMHQSIRTHSEHYYLFRHAYFTRQIQKEILSHALQMGELLPSEYVKIITDDRKPFRDL